ncbi:MAG TPA: class I SAM-dependent methyltransferase [Planctomycetota bacterium]|nr:class I SAM-dependent methyltransferase [Planctomycetota bacterium]HRR79881.1 class I SAM-dependent methyltransferase [Planctomycetota bacterium]HRT95507.1 class I SAM-dependent methyltransferase [Planctomycetota bacterium]
MSTVILKRGRAKPFFYGHPWVFSGSVARFEGAPADGELVTVVDDRGNFVAKGFYNGRSQIRVRLATWNPEETVDAEYFERRLRLAVALREHTLGLPAHTDAYRLVYSEGDGLPGLVVDRYADWLVVQILSFGLAVRKAEILGALQRVCPTRAIFERSDTDVAEKEGIEPAVGALAGPEPPGVVPVTVHGVRLLADVRGGQKTGLFLDQRENWRAVASFAEGRRVLDCFAYTGAFAVFASVVGKAAGVLAIEMSEPALALARRNAEANGAANVEFCQGNVFGELRRLRAEGQRFGLVILDPPKFARATGDVESALRGYKDINLIAMQLLEPGGILATCSCSQHIDDSLFVGMLNDAAFDTSREVQVLERRSQAADHPVSVTCPESRYLKCYVCRVL